MNENKFAQDLKIKKQIDILNGVIKNIHEDYVDIKFSCSEIADFSHVLKKAYLIREDLFLLDEISLADVEVEEDIILIVIRFFLDRFVSAKKMLDDDDYLENFVEIKFSWSQIRIGKEHIFEAILLMKKKRDGNDDFADFLPETHDITVLFSFLDKIKGASVFLMLS